MNPRRRARAGKNTGPTKKSAVPMERLRQATLVFWLLGGLLVGAVIFAYQPAWNAGYIWNDEHAI